MRSAGNTADATEASALAAFPIEAGPPAPRAVASVALTANRPAPQPTGNRDRVYRHAGGGHGAFRLQVVRLQRDELDIVWGLGRQRELRVDPTVAQRQLPHPRVGQGRRQHC